MEAPRLPTIFKQNRAKRFKFKPRYYDEAKERIDELRKKYQQEEQNAEKGGYEVEKFREKLSKKWQTSRQRNVNSSNRMLLMIIMILFFITYLIITY